MNYKIQVKYVYVAFMTSLAIVGCSKPSIDNITPVEPNTITEVWDFDNLDGWYYVHQDTATIEQWALNDGVLELTTRANTYDRTKMHSVGNDYAAGEFTWRTFVPEVGQCEQVSIGSWIYHDDHHELDFEVGSGKAAIREKCGAAPDELLACMTNQDFPFKSEYTPIKPGWHDFSIRLDVRKDGNYTATWSIDGEVKQTLDLQFGPEYGFHSCCSIENLKFIGDVMSTADYTAKYDKATFTGTRALKTSTIE